MALLFRLSSRNSFILHQGSLSRKRTKGSWRGAPGGEKAWKGEVGHLDDPLLILVQEWHLPSLLSEAQTLPDRQQACLSPRCIHPFSSIHMFPHSPILIHSAIHSFIHIFPHSPILIHSFM